METKEKKITTKSNRFYIEKNRLCAQMNIAHMFFFIFNITLVLG